MTAVLPSVPSSASEHTLLNAFQTSDWSYCTSSISFQLGTAFCLHRVPTTTWCSSQRHGWCRSSQTIFSHHRAVTSPVAPHCVLVLQTAPAWLVNLALYWFCVRPVLQFVQFSPFEPRPPIHLQFPLTQHYVSRFEKQTLFIIQVSNESNEQCQAKTDSCGTQNQEAQFTPLFDSKLPVTTEPCFQPVWYFHLTMFFFLAYKKLSQKPMENQDIWHLLLVLVSMVRITSSNDEIGCFDAVCS